MTRTNTVVRSDPKSLLAQPVCGYAANKDQRDRLIAWGLAPAVIFTAGEGSENLDEAIYKQYGRRGTVVIAGIGKVLGDTKAAVMVAARKIELAGVKMLDIAAEELATLSDHIDRALAFVAGAARMKSNRRAKTIGKRGGAAKGVAAMAARNAILAQEIVLRLCNAPELTIKRVAELLGPPFSASTLRRLCRANI